jgi:hypothetical protein
MSNDYDGVAGQAYDRGAECAMRFQRDEMRRYDWGNDPNVVKN